MSLCAAGVGLNGFQGDSWKKKLLSSIHGLFNPPEHAAPAAFRPASHYFMETTAQPPENRSSQELEESDRDEDDDEEEDDDDIIWRECSDEYEAVDEHGNWIIRLERQPSAPAERSEPQKKRRKTKWVTFNKGGKSKAVVYKAFL